MYSIWACTHTHTHTYTDPYEANNKIKIKSGQTKANQSNNLPPLLCGKLTEQRVIKASDINEKIVRTPRKA